MRMEVHELQDIEHKFEFDTHIIGVRTVDGNIVLAGQLLDDFSVLVGSLDGLESVRADFVETFNLVFSSRQGGDLESRVGSNET